MRRPFTKDAVTLLVHPIKNNLQTLSSKRVYFLYLVLSHWSHKHCVHTCPKNIFVTPATYTGRHSQQNMAAKYESCCAMCRQLNARRWGSRRQVLVSKWLAPNFEPLRWRKRASRVLAMFGEALERPPTVFLSLL